MSDEDSLITPEEEELIRLAGELDRTPLESYGETRYFDDANDLFHFLHIGDLGDHNWAFRGHANEAWELAPSLERLQQQSYKRLRYRAEEYMLRTFKRRAHHYLRDLPDDRDELEWLALMRHHGAPTRLLDWTRSPYVAAFFATAEAREGETSAVWAIDISAIRQEAIDILAESGSITSSTESGFSFSQRDAFNDLIMKETRPAVVVPVQPFKTNERITSQQGLFLCLNSVHCSFEFGLKQVLKSDRARMAKINAEINEADYPKDAPSFLIPRLFKLRIASQARGRILRELHRMNINYATLFPGLDGFCRSLGTTVTMSGFFPHSDVDEEV